MALHRLFLNYCFDKNRLKSLITWSLLTTGERRTISIVENLKELGFRFATKAGISLGLDDLKIPFEKVALVSQAKEQVERTQREYQRGNLTTIEKSQHLIDTWHRTSETLKQTVVNNFQLIDKLSPVYMMAFSGARGNISQVRQLAGMRGLMADPQGQIIGFPIRSNFREGLTLTEYMISCYGARKGLVDTALRTADAGYLTRRLVDVSQHMIVKTATCATSRGIVLKDLEASGKTILPLRDRLIGRVLAQDVFTADAPPSYLSQDKFLTYRRIGSAGPPQAFAEATGSKAWGGPATRGFGSSTVDHGSSTLDLRRRSKIQDEGPRGGGAGGRPQRAPSERIDREESSPSSGEAPQLRPLPGDRGSVAVSDAPEGGGTPPRSQRSSLIASRNQEISIGLAYKLASSRQQVSVRSPLTCSLRHGVCQLCYGWSLSEGRLVTLGEAVGIIAAQSIGEPGTQLTMRTFHTGGVFSGDVMAEIRAPYDGIVHFPKPLQGLLIRTSHGRIAFLTRTAGRLILARADKPALLKDAGASTIKGAQRRGGRASQGTASRATPGPRGGARQISSGLEGASCNAEDLTKDARERRKTPDAAFSLEVATVLFVRQGEKVRQAQLIAEFSSMGTEVNETIEAKRTLFSELAGQIFFANMAMGTRLKGNGEILQVSKDLGFIWVLSGKQCTSAPLLDVYTKGSHLVNSNSLVTRISRRKDSSTFPATRGVVGDGPSRYPLLPILPILPLEERYDRLETYLAIGKIGKRGRDAQLLGRGQRSPSLHRPISFLLTNLSKTEANPVPDIQPLRSSAAPGLRRGSPLLKRRVAIEPHRWGGVRWVRDSKDSLFLASEKGCVETDRTRSSSRLFNALLRSTGGSGSKGRYSEKSSFGTTSTGASKDREGGNIFLPERGYRLLTRSCPRASLSKATIFWFPSKHRIDRRGFGWIDSRYVNKRFVSGEVFWIDQEALVGDLSWPENPQFLSFNKNCVVNEATEALLLTTPHLLMRHRSANHRLAREGGTGNASNAAHNAELPTTFRRINVQATGFYRDGGGISPPLPSPPQSFPRWAERSDAMRGGRNLQGMAGRQSLSLTGWVRGDRGISRAAAWQSLKAFSPSSPFGFSPPERLSWAKSKVGVEKEHDRPIGIGQQTLLLRAKGRFVTLQRRNFYMLAPQEIAFSNLDENLRLTTDSYGKLYAKSGTTNRDAPPPRMVSPERPAAFVRPRSKQSSLNPLLRGQGVWDLLPDQTRNFFQFRFLPFEAENVAHRGMPVQIAERGVSPPDLLGYKRGSMAALGLPSHREGRRGVQVAVKKDASRAEPVTGMEPSRVSGTPPVSTQLVKGLLKNLQGTAPFLQDATQHISAKEAASRPQCLAAFRVGTRQRTGWGYYPQDTVKLTMCHQSMQHNDRSSLDDLVFDPASVYFDAFRSSAFLYCLTDTPLHCTVRLKILQRRGLSLSPYQRGKTFHPENTSSIFEHIGLQNSAGRCNKGMGLKGMTPSTATPSMATPGLSSLPSLTSLREVREGREGRRGSMATPGHRRGGYRTPHLDDVSKPNDHKIRQRRAWEPIPLLNTTRFASSLVPCRKRDDLENQLGRDVLLFVRKLVWLAQTLVGTPNLRLATGEKPFDRGERDILRSKRHQFQILSFKDLANHNSFLWLRGFALQQQVVTNKNARHRIAFPAHTSLDDASVIANGSEMVRGRASSRISKTRALESFVEGGSVIDTGSILSLADKEKSPIQSSSTSPSKAWSRQVIVPLRLQGAALDGKALVGGDWGNMPSTSFGASTVGPRARTFSKGATSGWPPSPAGPESDKEWYLHLYNWRCYLFASHSTRTCLLALIRRAHPHSLQGIGRSKSRLQRSWERGKETGKALLVGESHLLGLENDSRQSIECEGGRGPLPRGAADGLVISRGDSPPQSASKFATKQRVRKVVSKSPRAAFAVTPVLAFNKFQITGLTKPTQLALFAVHLSPPPSYLSFLSLTERGKRSKIGLAGPPQAGDGQETSPQLTQRLGLRRLAIQKEHHLSFLTDNNAYCSGHNGQPASPLLLMSSQGGEMISHDRSNRRGDRPSILDAVGAVPYGLKTPLRTQRISTAATLLTEADHFILSVNQVPTAHSPNLSKIGLMPSYQRSVGEFLNLGEEIALGQSAPLSGQIVSIERDKIALRRTQALLFYAQGAMHVNHGEWVDKNAPILTLTYQKLVTGDIVQGIPKIEQFFEAPATKEGEPLQNSLQAKLRRTFQRLRLLVPLAQAAKRSFDEIQQVLVEGILKVYLSQGVRIADKHLEIVIRQMTSKGHVLHVGNTGLFQGEHVNLDRIERINLATYGQKADYEPAVLGITQASLDSESFISAASFQETTRVLSRDTVVGKTDFLRGLKERVVLGDLIQAGTGLDDNINYGLLLGVSVRTPPPEVRRPPRIARGWNKNRVNTVGT